ncbi:MAG: tryptophan 2,3-dioxygenase family protein [Brumimicrobium sp.]|nr:tryptophan 2,3-dioxygenase family protein [Brumimicrobium sp.]
MEITPEIKEKLEKINAKYNALGQDMVSYLDGLLYADTVKYWDYISLDTLLSLQKPRTSFPDEVIFIVYHQITELYFKLALREFDQIAHNEDLTADFFVERTTRINRYFEALTKSFEIMVQGMEKEQFLKFRMALLPASGFQSAQYRLIEIASTDFINLVHKDIREKFKGDEPIEEMYEHIYWKEGATELASGKKTLTLEEFENEYNEKFIRCGRAYRNSNLWKRYQNLDAESQKREDVILALKQNDVNVNVNWPLVHYKSAVRYLHKAPTDISATGGTNWQKYLPPRFQKRIFYPALWSEEEKENWGKTWVEDLLGNV